jgi:hypothetical protein
MSPLQIAVLRLRGHNDAIAGLDPRSAEPAYILGYTKGKSAKLRILGGAILALLGLLISGCGTPLSTHYAVAIEPAFDESQRAWVESAVADWRTKTGADLSVTIQTCSGVSEGHICLHAGPSGHPGNCGWTSTAGIDGGEIWLDTSEVSGVSLQQAAAHELGHAMGLGHLGAGHVMSPNRGLAEGNYELTPADIAEWNSGRRGQ